MISRSREGGQGPTCHRLQTRPGTDAPGRYCRLDVLGCDFGPPSNDQPRQLIDLVPIILVPGFLTNPGQPLCNAPERSGARRFLLLAAGVRPCRLIFRGPHSAQLVDDPFLGRGDLIGDQAVNDGLITLPRVIGPSVRDRADLPQGVPQGPGPRRRADVGTCDRSPRPRAYGCRRHSGTGCSR
jgi:hypothetical protein